MKKILKTNSIKNLMNHITPEMYTKQTLVSLFRCLLETAMESRYNSTVLIKLADIQDFQGLLNRLKYSELRVYTYSDNRECESFTQIKLDNDLLKNDEFLVIIDERFSTSLFWDESTVDIFGLCEGFCSLDPYDARQIACHLQTVAFSEILDQELSNIKQDRRRNENFTKILRKLVSSLETRQRDLMCANTELKELYDKTLQTEKLAAIGQLCSTIAHELRNPLSSMDLYAKVISKTVEKINIDTKDQKSAESLETAASSISNAIVNLEKLLTELIDYSKPMTIEKATSDLEVTLNDVIKLVKPMFEKKEVDLAFNYNLDKNIQLAFDKSKLNQAVLNVVKNALEVSQIGDSIEISTHYLDEDNMVIIKVKDQGCGISTEDKEKIFTPYFTTKKEGTGLGLAHARKIMEAHEGSLSVISTSPKGTIFGLTLPVE